MAVRSPVRFRSASLGEVMPTGWILEFLRRQCSGITGHPEASGFPFDHAFWADPSERAEIADEAMVWWPYEQTGYWVDAALKAGHLAGDVRVYELARAQIDAAIDNAAPDGFIGPDMFRTRNRWPHHIFFRAVLAQYAITGDVRYRDALVRHYRSMPHPMVSSRDVSGVEILLALYADVGESDLLEMAQDLYERFNGQVSDRDIDYSLAGMRSDRPVAAHGVTFNEIAKLGAMVFAASGDRDKLDATLHGYDKVAEEHTLADGLHSGAERMSGRDALASHESCTIADHTWSLGILTTITGTVAFADRLEHVIFNALPGAIMKDFSALQYFSCPNQLLATATSNHNEMSRGDNRMSFRPGHPVQCCTGNIQRAMPNYVEHMWMRSADGDDEVAAAMFGPSTFEGTVAGTRVRITEDTAYPFEQAVTFHLALDEPTQFGFTIRIPSWCRQPTLTINHIPVDENVEPGTFHRIERRWSDGDRLDLGLPFTTELTRWPDAGVSIELGPLTLSLPVDGDPKIDPIDDWEQTPVEFRLSGPLKRVAGFPAYSVQPTGDWAYALAVDDDTLPAIAEIEWSTPPAFPFDTHTPAVRVRVPARRVAGWELQRTDAVTRSLPSFDDGRFRMIETVVAGDYTLTPPLPDPRTLATRLGDDIEWVTLIPYGNTLLRLTVFPTERARCRRGRPLRSVVTAAGASDR